MRRTARCPRGFVPCAASGRPSRGHGDRPAPQGRHQQQQARQRRLPQSGYFADADPNAEVRPALGFVESADISKRPGRYQSDFIWNTDWQSQLDREAAAEERRKRQKEVPAPMPTGGLGLTRMHDLNRMDIDLSEQLKRRKVEPKFTVGAIQGKPRSTQVKPFQAESRRWERSGRFTPRTAGVPLVDETELLETAAAESAQYEQLKLDLQTWTLAFSVFGFASCWILHSKDFFGTGGLEVAQSLHSNRHEVAVSYAVGAVGSFLYLRMLNKSVESMTGGGLGGAIGQPRLLIPLVLALGYNRWNQLKAEEVGLTLQLLPMLLGFFTYKAAVVGKQGAILLGDLASSTAAKEAQGSGGL